MGEKPSFLSRRKTPEFNDPILENIIDAENDIIDMRSKAHFLANLFTVETLQDADYEELRREFIEQYSQCQNIRDRFGLFVNPSYFEHLNSLDLGITRDPRDPRATSRLSNQYRQLRDTLIKHRVITGELPREACGRTIHFRHNALIELGADSKEEDDDSINDWYIGERNRPLIEFEYRVDQNDENGQEYIVKVEKRMTFAVTPDVPAAVANRNGRVEDPTNLALMEKALDIRHPSIVPIRTLYWVSKRKKGVQAN
jgi:hypothetical protein